MKRFVVLMLAVAIAIAYGIPSGLAAESVNDPKILKQIQDEVLAYTEEALSSDDYVVENVCRLFMFPRNTWKNWLLIRGKMFSLDIHLMK